MYGTDIKLTEEEKDRLLEKIVNITIEFSNAKDIPDTYHYRAEWIGYNVTKELYKAGLIHSGEKMEEQMTLNDFMGGETA